MMQALARHARVERHLAGVDDPEPVSRGALLEQPLPGRNRDVLAGLGQLSQLGRRHAAQEGLRCEYG